MVIGPAEHAAHVRAHGHERGQAHAGPGGERHRVPKAAHENARRDGEDGTVNEYPAIPDVS